MRLCVFARDFEACIKDDFALHTKHYAVKIRVSSWFLSPVFQNLCVFGSKNVEIPKRLNTMKKLPEAIRLRGVRQNNLKGIDVDVPVGKLVVVTGLSGAGKSSLVFETLHAEGQRRYVETFSPYTRQFLELLPEASVDAVENVRPSIAIKQGNSVKTSRSTVGTMTELCDWMKIWFAHHAELIDPATGTPLRAWSPATVWLHVRERFDGERLVVAFLLERPKKIRWEEILPEFVSRGFTKILAEKELFEIDDFLQNPQAGKAGKIFVVADRIRISDTERSRFIEAAASAMKLGGGILFLFKKCGNGNYEECGAFADKLVSPKTRRRFREASPALFSFNSPVGACPRCRGFGRVIEVDWKKVIPDETKTLAEGVFAPFSGEVYGESQADLMRACRRKKIPTNVPWNKLPAETREYILAGDADWTEAEWSRGWYGVRRFFSWLESTSYKMHVRVFLSRFRAYVKCPECAGTRFREESLCWKWRGFTLPELYSKTVDELLELTEDLHFATSETSAQRAEDVALVETRNRLSYLREVGLGYLTLDRQSRTLSGGETQRVNLTACLGASLANTLFILDEPSVGLHARDLGKMVSILRRLVSGGNTVVVVEHDESVMRAADWLIEIGPKPGAEGGLLVYSGVPEGILKCKNSVTGAWLSGARVPALANPEAVVRGKKTPEIKLAKVFAHNLKNFSASFPMRALVGLCGVSGSGKSTLLNNVLAHFAEDKSGVPAEDDFELPPFKFESGEPIAEVVLVDQSPVSKTPRSNTALYSGVWEHIRNLLSDTEEAQRLGLASSHFSFNSGDGRCPHCGGAGWEAVEMQFLSDVHVPCPVCEGRRFRREVLEFLYNGKNVAEILDFTVSEAKSFFAGTRKIVEKLELLESIGLGYLSLGQPLNTLSGGEAQRLKLVKFLTSIAAPEKGKKKTERGNAGRLILLDEPTTGLHREDVSLLIKILKKLVAAGNTVVVVEHQTDVLLACDWLLELGPDAGEKGGKLVAAGTPSQLANGNTATAPFLREAQNATKNFAPGFVRNAVPASPENAAGISLRGVREHNLKNVSLEIPHRALTVFTGVSGSGKSSLAFDVIFAEGQRRFMECMSAYARQFVEQMPRPDADVLTGLPPTVAIEQRITRGSAKSTVATVTEVAQYLRLLYARIGVMHNPRTGTPLVAGTQEQVCARVAEVLKSCRKNEKLLLAAPLIRNRKGHHQPLATWAIEHGYEKLRIDGIITELKNFKPLDRYKEHDIEAVVAEISVADSGVLKKAVSEALRLGKGIALLLGARGNVVEWLSRERIDPETGEAFPELDPKNFSWNSPRGWCPECHGHGRVVEAWGAEEDALNDDALSDKVSRKICPVCRGERLNALARAVRIFTDEKKCATGTSFSLPELLALSPAQLLDVLEHLKLNARDKAVAARIVPEVRSRLRFLDGVGLGYLTLDRASNTLSGGEAQRIRLAAQLGSNLSGALYVLDEPSIGLHPRDNVRLIRSLKDLRDRGNTVLVVEHDEETMRAADYIVDMGPGSGTQGGEILFSGAPKQLLKNAQAKNSRTAKFLSAGIAHPMRGAWRSVGKSTAFVSLRGARLRNLKNIDVKFAVGRLNVVCGVSGAGKSTLVSDLLAPALAFSVSKKIDTLTSERALRERLIDDDSGKTAFRELRGGNVFRKLIVVDQEPIGKTSRSTPATYIGAFDIIRQVFATLPEARMRGLSAGFFSFNTKGGRCETCAGAGRVKLEMNFMPDTSVVCEDCAGTRYSPAVADIRWNGKNIADVLAMTFAEAAEFFSFHKKLQEICALMTECGLGYLTLGQSSPTLSGGESQRLKLVSELVTALPSWKERMGKAGAGTPQKNCYILEEPTIGLHQADCEKLLHLLHRLADEGHTVIVVEHHADVLAEADHIIEIGPEGGNAGGRLLYQGDLPGLAKLTAEVSPTAPFLPKLGGNALSGCANAGGAV